MDHTKELIALAHEGNKEARDMLVMHNMGLVYSCLLYTSPSPRDA